MLVKKKNLQNEQIAIDLNFQYEKIIKYATEEK